MKSSYTNTNTNNRIFKIGDSIIIHVKSNELSHKVENFKVYVKSFSAAKVRYMEDYLQPTQREMPFDIIHHVGLNGVAT